MLRFCVVLLAVVGGGCVISEQIGDMGGVLGNDAPLAFHFGTGFNQAIVYGRSLLLVGLAVWIFRAESGGSRVLTVLIGVPALVAAGYLLYKDVPKLNRFRLDVSKSLLTVQVPPRPRREIAWDTIEAMRVEGFEWHRGAKSPWGKKQIFGDLPDWKTMHLTLAGGETYTMDLEPLSIEQRGIFFRAIAKYAGLVEQ